MSALDLRIVSINIWDLPIPLPGLDRALRRGRLLARLPRMKADLLLIQEAFQPGFRNKLLARLPEYVPDALALESRRQWPLRWDNAGGLLTLSRWPITQTVHQPTRRFRGMKLDERWSRKGCLWTRIATPAGEILIGNVHLYAGNRPRDARVRTFQVRQLLAYGQLTEGVPTIMAGDFNMAAEHEQPPRGENGFAHMARAGFTEVGGGWSPGITTMAPSSNRYARYMPWHRPDRRLTQVFYRGPGLYRGDAPPTLCLHEPPVSDHFGLCVTLRLETG